MVGGFIGGLAGASVPSGALVTIALTGAGAVAGATVAPVAFAAGLAATSFIVATTVLGGPGFVYGVKKTVDRLLGKAPKAAKQKLASTAPPATVFGPGTNPTPAQIAAYVDSLPDQDRGQVMDKLRELSLDDFGEAAALERPVMTAKTASFTRKAKPAVAVTP